MDQGRLDLSCQRYFLTPISRKASTDVRQLLSSRHMAISYPRFSAFGSTNLNSRSSHLDTELSFVMMTSSHTLRQRLQEEVQALRLWAVPWKGLERRVLWTTK